MARDPERQPHGDWENPHAPEPTSKVLDFLSGANGFTAMARVMLQTRPGLAGVIQMWILVVIALGFAMLIWLAT